jgi:hypothetical protein
MNLGVQDTAAAVNTHQSPTIYIILVKTSKRKRSLGRYRHRRGQNIKNNVTETGCEDVD